jgi:hypothetical protein
MGRKTYAIGPTVTFLTKTAPALAMEILAPVVRWVGSACRTILLQ